MYGNTMSLAANIKSGVLIVIGHHSLSGVIRLLFSAKWKTELVSN